MRKLIPKEELDALFKEIYSAETGEKDYSINVEKGKRLEHRYKFLMYKYRSILRKTIVSSLPLRIKFLKTEVLKNSEIEDRNRFLFPYDIEGKYRFYVGISENITEIESKLYKEDIYSIIKKESSFHNLMESISNTIVKQIQSDFPFRFKKVPSSAVQFYNEDYITAEYHVGIEDTEVVFSLFFEELMIEAVEVDSIIYSNPTSYGKKLIEKLKKRIMINISVESEPCIIDINKLKVGETIELNQIKITNRDCGGEQ
ncbi:hypothetical protein [Persephonella sp.]